MGRAQSVDGQEPHPGSSRRARTRSSWSRIWEYRVLYLFLALGVVSFLVFNYAPMAGLVMVFQHYDPVSGFLHSPWVGLENFRRIFGSPVFLRALRNTAIISSLKIAVEFPLPILFALLLNELRRARFKKNIQTISYLPNFVSWVIVSGLWYKLLAPDVVVNELLVRVGVVTEAVPFMQSREWFYPVILLTDVWKNLGYQSILYLAAIAGIDVELYEAATVDGASRLARARYVTLPGIRQTIVLILILDVSDFLSAGFDQLWTMGNIATREVADILDTAILRTLTTGSLEDLSVGAAMGFFTALVGFTLFVVSNRISRALKQETLI